MQPVETTVSNTEENEIGIPPEISNAEKPIFIRAAKRYLPDDVISGIRPTYNRFLLEYHKTRFKFGLLHTEFEFSGETYSVVPPPNQFDLTVQKIVSDGIIAREFIPLSTIKTDAAAVIDIGGHFGLYSLLLKTINPNTDLYVFEPDRYNRSILRQVLEKNKLEGGVRPDVVTGENGFVTFYLDAKSGSESHSIVPKNDSFSAVKKRAIALSDFLLERNIDDVFLKIDAEGAEVEILEDLLTVDGADIRGIVELHPDKMGCYAGTFVQQMFRGCSEFEFITDGSPAHHNSDFIPFGFNRPIYKFEI